MKNLKSMNIIIDKTEVEKMYKIISSNVKALRKSKGISQLDLALAIDIRSTAFYSNCENNKNNKHFNLEHLYKISKVLNVEISEFFKGL